MNIRNAALLAVVTGCLALPAFASAHAPSAVETADVTTLQQPDDVKNLGASSPAASGAAVIDGALSPDYLQHPDPWTIGTGSYSSCVQETNYDTCLLRCKCGLDANKKKCNNQLACLQAASLEKSACDAHCLTDF
jgi:hypothetical protein